MDGEGACAHHQWTVLRRLLCARIEAAVSRDRGGREGVVRDNTGRPARLCQTSPSRRFDLQPPERASQELKTATIKPIFFDRHILEEYTKLQKLKHMKRRSVVGAVFIGVEWVTELEYFFPLSEKVIIIASLLIWGNGGRRVREWSAQVCR